MKLQVGVKALIRYKDKFLLLLNNPEKYPDFKQWSIPGGRITPGTLLIDNLERELFEEIGVNINVDSAKVIDIVDILKKDKHVVRITYEIELQSGIDIKLSDEHIEYRWISKDGIKGLDNLDAFVRNIV